MEQKKAVRLEWWGIPVIFAASLILRFCYRWSDGAMWAVLFGAINESVWESVKIITLPYLVWAAVELCIVRVPLRTMVTAKAIGVFAMAGSYIALAWVLSSIAGDSVFLPYLCSFVVIVGGQALSALILRHPGKLPSWYVVASFALLLYLAMLLTFTISPPSLPLFQDPDTLTYGLLPRPADAGLFFGEGLFT